MRQLSEIAAASRTLILSLVLGLGVLVPLRFFEAGSELALAESEMNAQALIQEALALRIANANRNANQAVAMGYSFDNQEAVLGVSTQMPVEQEACLMPEKALELVNVLTETVVGKPMTSADTTAFAAQVGSVMARVCQ